MKEQKKLIKIKHQANSGDLIALLCGVKQLHKETGRKFVIYQQLDVPAAYYVGATHPVTDENGTMVMMSKSIFDMIKPLVESQSYIERMEVYAGQEIDFDIDVIRGETFTNMPCNPIQRWVGYAIPELFGDISKQWLKVDKFKEDTGKIILNFTNRYRNHRINYFFLKEYQNDCLFIGTESEYNDFKDKWGLHNLARFNVHDFCELAVLINSSRFFIGNQSMAYNIAEAMKTPRILELCQYAPNCTVTGDDAYEFFHQQALEMFFKKMYNG